MKLFAISEKKVDRGQDRRQDYVPYSNGSINAIIKGGEMPINSRGLRACIR